ncbi:hypothetical protein KCU65_g191, partial [Aureobasidium melanogenum]
MQLFSFRTLGQKTVRADDDRLSPCVMVPGMKVRSRSVAILCKKKEQSFKRLSCTHVTTSHPLSLKFIDPVVLRSFPKSHRRPMAGHK